MKWTKGYSKALQWKDYMRQCKATTRGEPLIDWPLTIAVFGIGLVGGVATFGIPVIVVYYTLKWLGIDLAEILS